MKKFISIIAFVLICLSTHLKAQTVIEVSPLFEYPVAPESLESLEDKCNYLVKNFWNDFNFKAKNPVDQYSLNHAFQVYTSTMQYASKKEVDNSLEKLIKNISGNQILLMQFTKAAEDCLYGPNAEIWSDEIYLKFLDALLKDKKIKADRKTKYALQANVLRNSGIGMKAPQFDFINTQGESKKYFPMSTPTILIFANPENTDWRLSRLKMDSNYSLQEALDKGKINILFIVPKDLKEWQNTVSNYNGKWTIGQNVEIPKVYDIRIDPAIYVIDSSGNISAKNISPENAVALTLQMVN